MQLFPYFNETRGLKTKHLRKTVQKNHHINLDVYTSRNFGLNQFNKEDSFKIFTDLMMKNEKTHKAIVCFLRQKVVQ